MQDNIAIVASQYTDASWNVVVLRRLCDIVATNGKKIHFVKVVTKTTIDNYLGGFKNNFVQNAFSNGALPIYAHVEGNNVKFEDVNCSTRVIVGKKKVAAEPSHVNTEPTPTVDIQTQAIQQPTKVPKPRTKAPKKKT